jgi:predicted AlkP superfamily pyrophosphatase or phosphodiesterase
MKLPRVALGLLLCLLQVNLSFASAYNGRPKLVVIVVIDQFRADYLERYRDQFGEGGFRLFLDHGAYFTNCHYNYANTHTAPGHATLFTGAYSSGHGIMNNEWWDPQKKRMVTSVQDDATKIVGIASSASGSSPHNLQADTLGDELKLATQGKSRVFGVSLKDRASVLPAGFAGNGAYWIDAKSGAWITSTYYRNELPKWVQDFNDGKHTDKYLNLEWKDASGNVLRTTKPQLGKPNFYDVVGATPYANDYEFDFARDLITYEKLGSGPATDLLIVSLSANDILGHKVGLDTPEMQAMALTLDRQLAGFFDFLGHQFGLANVWIGLSADHGVGPVPAVAAKLHIPAQALSADKMEAKLNSDLSAKLTPGHQTKFIEDFGFTTLWLNNEAFTAAKVKEEDAERMVGEALKQMGIRGYYTKSQLARNDVPNTIVGQKYANSYSPLGGWNLLAVPPPYVLFQESGSDHGSPYTYDAHVPLLFYGIPFQSGTYRTSVEPVDMVATLASLLGINAPTHAVGRVLTESLATKRGEAPEHQSSPPLSQIKPVAVPVQEALR